MSTDVKQRIENDVLELLDRLTMTEVKQELKKLKIKGYNGLNVLSCREMLKNALLSNRSTIWDLYNSHKLKLDMFQKEVLATLGITKTQMNKLDLKVTGTQTVYIKTHHYYDKYDRESVYTILEDMNKKI